MGKSSSKMPVSLFPVGLSAFPILVMVVLMGSAPSQTTIPGGILTGTNVWSQGQYLVQGDVTIPVGSTLAISPGVTVLFAPFDSVGSGSNVSRCEIIVQGSLLVQGTAAAPVAMRGSVPASMAWQGILCAGGTVDLQNLRVFDASLALNLWANSRASLIDVLYLNCAATVQANPGATMVTWWGDGCPGAGGVPRLRAGFPYLGNTGFQMTLSGAHPLSACFLCTAFAHGSSHLGGGCTRHVGDPLIVSLAFTDANGTLVDPVTMPTSSSFVGLEFYSQAGVVDPAGAFLGLFSVSNALRMLIGY